MAAVDLYMVVGEHVILTANPTNNNAPAPVRNPPGWTTLNPTIASITPVSTDPTGLTATVVALAVGLATMNFTSGTLNARFVINIAPALATSVTITAGTPST